MRQKQRQVKQQTKIHHKKKAGIEILYDSCLSFRIFNKKNAILAKLFLVFIQNECLETFFLIYYHLK